MSHPSLMLPGNPRYQPKSLAPIFGYDMLYCPVGEVEIATMQVLGEIGLIPEEEIRLLDPGVIERILSITTTEVDSVERAVTGHDIRAWVRCAQEILPQPLQRWIHVPLTSYDPLDTARTLQFLRAYNQVINPHVREVVGLFAKLIRKFADQLQIGRTHGQHALPITVGFWLAGVLHRIIYNAQMVDARAKELVGKISGAVGAHNAQIALGIASRCGSKTFEERVLEKLGLKPASISTQILPPEPLAYFLHACVMLSAALGQFGRDCRHLMRSEIAEVAEEFKEGQIGSSTMAHKRNPITFENLEGMYLRSRNEYGKVWDTLMSEHQRDLVGSSLARDFPIIVVNLVYQLEVLLRKDKRRKLPFLERITIDSQTCWRNFEKSAPFILAEPIYLLLQMAGYVGDAHKLVSDRAMPIAQGRGIPLIRAIELIADEDDAVQDALAGIAPEHYELLIRPERYVGDAKEQALKIADYAEAYIGS